MTRKLSLVIPGAGALALLVILALVGTVRANPSQVYRNNPSTATTTLTYLTAATAATTTNTFNTQGDGGANADTAAFTICGNASTTATAFNVTFEYSYDSVTWFQNEWSPLATTTAAASFAMPQSMTWLFASTSVGGLPVSALNNHACKIASVATPIQYVRAVISVTGANGAVWSDFGAKREQR